MSDRTLRGNDETPHEKFRRHTLCAGEQLHSRENMFHRCEFSDIINKVI